MAIFRGTGGSGNSTDDSIVSAVTTQAGIATTKAGEAATSASNANTSATNAATSATTATTKANEASASATTASTKATEANTAKTAAESAQTAAETARDTAQTHANTANNSSVQTVAGISTEVQNLDNIKTDITSVNTIKSDVTTVAGISSNVTTVAADASDIGTVASNIANVNSVGDNIANVNAVHSNASNINTVAADGTDIGTVASNISNVNTVAGISSDVTTVAGLESKMDTVIADASDIGAVANNISDVSTVAGINADVDTVAGISAKVTTVADNITDVQNADTNAANASTSASQAANSASAAGASATTASTKATEASNSATAASNSATTATTKATEAAGSATTATTKATEASTSATNAATSATTATTKASEAASSATAASGSATTATTKASEASVSAASAATSATDASNAENAWSSFYATYLGSYSAPPTVDVQGNALQTGAFYYDTGAGSNTVGLYVYNGSTWVYSTNYNNVTAPYSLAQDLATNSYDISFGDNAKATFGASNDLEIFHDGNNSRITDTGTGSLILRGQNSVEIEDVSGENMAVFTSNGAATLYYNDSAKIATTSTGIEVTGNVSLGDNGKATFGAGNDLEIYSDGATGIIQQNANGVLLLKGQDFYVQNDAGGNFLRAEAGGAVRLYHNGSGKLDTTATGIDVTGTVTADGLIVDGTDSLRSSVDDSLINISGGNATNSGANYALFGETHASLAGVHRWRTDGNERMRIDASGNVGIGTSSPNYELTVAGGGNNSIQIVSSTTGTGASNGLRLWNTGSSTAMWNYDNTPTLFSTNNTERMRIDSSGNVGIGTDSPAELLHVHEDTTGVARMRLSNTDGYLEIGTNNQVMNLDSQTHTFRNEAGSTEYMRIDSSGNVLVGTTSQISSGKLSVAGGTSANGITATTAATSGYAAASLQRTASDGELINFKKGATNVGSIGNNGSGLYLDSVATGYLSHNGTRMFNWDASQFYPQANGAKDLGHSSYRWRDLHLSGGIKGSTLTFSGNGSSEHARIDSSGNVLVGKTSQAYATTGLELENAGRVVATRDGASAGIFARLNSDGNIVDFRKGGATVGAIGTIGGDTYFQHNGTGIRLWDGNEAITPCGASGATADGTRSLGASEARFKDLYLSGGVHLGGTGSANKLDDYEEGTFTLTTYSDSTGAFNGTPTCLYTKIGNTVNVFITFRVGTNFTSQSVGGLPFTTSHSGMNSTYISGGIAITSNNNTVSATLSHNGTAIRFHDNQNTSDAHLPNTTDEYYRLNFTYKTA